MTPQKTQVKPEVELDQPIKFETVQLAAEWLKNRALSSGVDAAVVEDIEAVGKCDEQSKTRVERYCAAMDLQSSRFTW